MKSVIFMSSSNKRLMVINQAKRLFKFTEKNEGLCRMTRKNNNIEIKFIVAGSQGMWRHTTLGGEMKCRQTNWPNAKLKLNHWIQEKATRSLFIQTEKSAPIAVL